MAVLFAGISDVSGDALIAFACPAFAIAGQVAGVVDFAGGTFFGDAKSGCTMVFVVAAITDVSADAQVVFANTALTIFEVGARVTNISAARFARSVGAYVAYVSVFLVQTATVFKGTGGAR